MMSAQEEGTIGVRIWGKLLETIELFVGFWEERAA